ncbi:hypothetical protein SNEBB_006149 [Seison nebaliae]|nr:hypothetical protein SNEBB_006149 [Seison nebaliae]
MRPSPYVFLKCLIDGTRVCDPIIIELLINDVPVSTKMFLSLCTGQYGLSYVGSYIHSIEYEKYCLGGDIYRHDGTGGRTLHTKTVSAENFVVRFDQPYVVGLVETGRKMTGSQFFITFKPIPSYTGRQVGIGIVTNPDSLLPIMEQTDPVTPVPKKSIRIVDAGEIYKGTIQPIFISHDDDNFKDVEIIDDDLF